MKLEGLKEVVADIDIVSPERGDGWVWVPAAKVAEACCWLRDRHGFDCCSCITGTDRGEWIELVYHLFSYAAKATVVLKAKLDRAAPTIASVAMLWPAADWMEREVFDLLGVSFVGHPNLKRILLPDDWEGHPLRKDYQEPAVYAGMTTTRP